MKQKVKSLAEYYGSQVTGTYTTAKAISDAFSQQITEAPAYFRRSEIVDRLKLKTNREVALLSDALYLLQQRGLISWDSGANQWKNLSR